MSKLPGNSAMMRAEAMWVVLQAIPQLGKIY
jgi:hypothetical protein